MHLRILLGAGFVVAACGGAPSPGKGKPSVSSTGGGDPTLAFVELVRTRERASLDASFKERADALVVYEPRVVPIARGVLPELQAWVGIGWRRQDGHQRIGPELLARRTGAPDFFQLRVTETSFVVFTDGAVDPEARAAIGAIERQRARVLALVARGEAALARYRHFSTIELVPLDALRRESDVPMGPETATSLERLSAATIDLRPALTQRLRALIAASDREGLQATVLGLVALAREQPSVELIVDEGTYRARETALGPLAPSPAGAIGFRPLAVQMGRDAATLTGTVLAGPCLVDTIFDFHAEGMVLSLADASCSVGAYVRH